MKAKVAIFVRDTSLLSVLHNYNSIMIIHQRVFKLPIKVNLNTKDIQVMERTRNYNWINQGEITQKVWKQKLLFLYATHRHDLFHLTVKYDDYIQKGIKVTERTRICIKSIKGEITQSMKTRALIFVRNTSSLSVLHTLKYHQNSPNGFQADTEMFTDGRTPDSSLCSRTFRSREYKVHVRKDQIRIIK